MDEHIRKMGRFTAIGMRTKVEDPNALVINTCSGNGTANRGTERSWTWCNPTNIALIHPYADITALSVECLWQGCKIIEGQERPDILILGGAWQRAKGKRPTGAWAGAGQPLITDPGAARRAIYLPAYERLIDHWVNNDDQVLNWVETAGRHKHGPVYLRDHDTGRGLDRNGPMSHAWLLAYYLNHLHWPT